MDEKLGLDNNSQIATLRRWGTNLAFVAEVRGIILNPESSREIIAKIIGFSDWKTVEGKTGISHSMRGLKTEESTMDYNLMRLHIMARQVRKIFKGMGVTLGLGAAKEIVAQFMMFKDWNTVVAKAKSGAIFLGPSPDMRSEG